MSVVNDVEMSESISLSSRRDASKETKIAQRSPLNW